MILIAVALLIEEVADGIAVELRGIAEEFAEAVSDHFEVVGLTGRSICIRELLVAQAECCGCVALRQAEHCVVAGIVEAARHLVIGVAVAAPAQAALGLDVLAAHIGIVEVQAVLKDLRVVIGACCGDGERAAHGHQGRGGHDSAGAERTDSADE